MRIAPEHGQTSEGHTPDTQADARGSPKAALSKPPMPMHIASQKVYVMAVMPNYEHPSIADTLLFALKLVMGQSNRGPVLLGDDRSRIETTGTETEAGPACMKS